jgi:hypothetical protein
MKITYTLIAILGFLTLTFAQLPNSFLEKKMSKEINFDYKKNDLNKNRVHKTASVNSGWFSYIGAKISFTSPSYKFWIDYLFPDSLGYIECNPSYSFPCNLHHAGDVLDVNALPFMIDPNTNFIGSTNSYFLDSIAIGFVYQKNIVAGSDDTLIITIFTNTSPTNLTDSFLVAPYAINFGTDTVSFKDISYDYLTNSVSAAGKYQFKAILTDLDTNYYGSTKKIALPTPFFVPAGKLLFSDVQFKPGYTYTLGTHINISANPFAIFSLEENGFNTFQTYSDCNFGSAACDWNCSYVVDKSVRYNMSSGAWNGRYIPTYAFPSSYGTDHFDISYHLFDSVSYPCVVNSSISILADTLMPGNYNCYDYSTGSGTLSYLWDFGDGTTSTLAAPSHTYSPPGAYVVCLTVSASAGTVTCTDTYCDSSSVLRMSSGFLMSHFNVIPQNITSIKQIESNLNINFYPNPINDELNIEVTSDKNFSLNYVLVDGLGRELFRGEINSNLEKIKTSSLAKGFYNLSLYNSDGYLMKTIKLVK